MFKRIAQLFAPLKIQDPVFGELRFQKVGFWEGNCFFPPFNQTIDLTIQADETGPTAAHRQHFHELCQRWNDLIESARPMIVKCASEWLETSDVGPLRELIKLEGVDIPDPSTSPMQWDVGFWCEEAQHWILVVFHDWTPMFAHIDG